MKKSNIFIDNYERYVYSLLSLSNSAFKNMLFIYAILALCKKSNGIYHG